MLELIKPTLKQLSFKQELLNDEETMSFNHKYGGTIDFNRDRWQSWYDKWIGSKNPHYFYRYLYSNEYQCFVGEIAYHYEDDRYLCDVIIHSKYRNLGYGSKGLDLLCKCAKENGINVLYDDILLDNSSVHMFLKHGFHIVDKTEECYIVRKYLI